MNELILEQKNLKSIFNIQSQLNEVKSKEKEERWKIFVKGFEVIISNYSEAGTDNFEQSFDELKLGKEIDDFNLEDVD